MVGDHFRMCTLSNFTIWLWKWWGRRLWGVVWTVIVQILGVFSLSVSEWHYITYLGQTPHVKTCASTCQPMCLCHNHVKLLFPNWRYIWAPLDHMQYIYPPIFAINNLVSVQIGLFCRNRANEFVARGGQKISKLAIVNFAVNSVEICLLCKSGNLGDSTGSAIFNAHRFQRGWDQSKMDNGASQPQVQYSPKFLSVPGAWCLV